VVGLAIDKLAVVFCGELSIVVLFVGVVLFVTMVLFVAVGQLLVVQVVLGMVMEGFSIVKILFLHSLHRLCRAYYKYIV